ncbi:hypothetical protein C7E15_00375 [Stenotrophomonas maltophilia]|nr:hypothetical protein C7E15_00375 [Stenotrophomonas maltophilia]
MRIQESRASLGEIWKSRASLWGNTGGQLWDLGRFRCGSHRAYLQSYSWPGNVRELHNYVERSLILGHFPTQLERLESLSDPRSRLLSEVERRHILAVLRETGGDRERAATILGISRKTIDRKCSSWNVSA